MTRKVRTWFAISKYDIDILGAILEQEAESAYIFEAFVQYFDQAKNKKKITEFVRQKLNCQSPKTKKAAKEFLKRIDENINK